MLCSCREGKDFMLCAEAGKDHMAALFPLYSSLSLLQASTTHLWAEFVSWSIFDQLGHTIIYSSPVAS